MTKAKDELTPEEQADLDKFKGIIKKKYATKDELTTQSDNTLDELRVKLVVYMSFYVEARDQKDPIEMSRWIDKIEELFSENISSLASAIKALELPNYDDTDLYQQGYMWAIGQAITVIQSERAKLKEVK